MEGQWLTAGRLSPGVSAPDPSVWLHHHSWRVGVTSPGVAVDVQLFRASAPEPGVGQYTWLPAPRVDGGPRAGGKANCPPQM